jgi:LPS O-antigen subunit length determinant protein (WzzB/FepE family)
MGSLVQNIPECASFLPGAGAVNATPSPVEDLIQANVELWQGVVLVICFGAFALLISLIHRLVR